MNRLFYLICKLRGRHRNAVMEFHGARASKSEGRYFGEPSIAVYKVTCPLCKYSTLIGEDEISEEIMQSLEDSGRYKDIVRLKRGS